MEKFSSEFTAGKQTRFARTWCRTTLLPHARITLCVRDLTSTSLVAGVAAVLPAWAPCSWFQLSHKTNQRLQGTPVRHSKGSSALRSPARSCLAVEEGLGLSLLWAVPCSLPVHPSLVTQVGVPLLCHPGPHQGSLLSVFSVRLFVKVDLTSSS